MAGPSKQRLFEIGAAAAQTVFGTGGLYVCPICGGKWPGSAVESGQLTLEHIPPKSLGGRGMALTCKRCNHTAGHLLDAAVANRRTLARFEDVLRTGREAPHTLNVLRIAGDSVNVNVSGDGRRIRIDVLGDQNNPSTSERVTSYFRGLARTGRGDGETFELTPQTRSPYSPRLAQVGDLKTAFLAAFAAFGYRYAFDKRLEIVRRQILSPKDHIISSWNVQIDVELDRFAMIWTKDPPGLFVKVDRVVIVLPWLLGPIDFYSPEAVTWRSQKAVRLSGGLVRWPTTLEMGFDFTARKSMG